MKLDPITAGLNDGLAKAFGPGGAAEKALTGALDKGLAPLFDEMRELRRYKARHSWRPAEGAPDWLKDGRGVLVSVGGDIMFAAWFVEGGVGYWDRDVEYGGSPVEPDWVFILPRTPPKTVGADASGSDSSRLRANASEHRDTPS